MTPSTFLLKTAVIFFGAAGFVGLSAATNTGARLGGIERGGSRSLTTARFEGLAIATNASRRADHVVVPFNVARAREFEVRAVQGTGTVAAAAAIETTRDATNLLLRPNTPYFVRERSAPTGPLAVSTNRAYLPDQGVVADAAGRVAKFKLYVESESDSMRWAPDRNAFATRLVVGVESPDNPEVVARALPQTLLFTRASLNLATNQVALEKATPDGARHVEIWSPLPRRSASLRVLASFGASDVVLSLRWPPVSEILALILPLPLLVFAVVGGLLGAALSPVVRRGEKRWLRLCQGTVVALVVVAGASVGVVFIPGISPGVAEKAAGALVLGFLGGYAGLKLVDARLAAGESKPDETRG